MSFAFNFPDPSPSEGDVTQVDDGKEPTSGNNDELVEPFKEIFASKNNFCEDISTVSYKVSDDVCIKCLDSQVVEKSFSDRQESDCCISKASQQHSDLIPNVYEGGLKVWECAIDLIEYLHKIDFQFDKKSVLELGCGAGLPGIMAMMKGAENVHLQDYNMEVIEAYTIPNLELNKSDTHACSCRYFSGDWNNFRTQMEQENIRYDVILTAETIYKTENYRKLTQIFNSFMKKDGVVFVAAKSHYFGVGGGVCDFESFVNNEGLFDLEICLTIETGVPRQILKLTRKNSLL